MTTELETQGGMHIESDPKTGAIAASNAAAVEEAIKKSRDDQPEQTEAAAEKEPQEFVDPRQAIRDKIYANRAEQFKKELEYAAAMDLGATAEQIVEDRQEDAPETANAVEEKKEPVVEEPKQPAKRHVNVGGHLYELTEAEIEQLAQRTLYAEEQARRSYQQPQQIQQQVQPNPDPVQQIAPDQERLKEIARKITYGSEEESTRALSDLVGLTASLASKNNIDPNQLVQATTQNVLAQVQFQDNLKAIASEYADVFEDSDKTFIAARKVGELRQKNAMLGVQKPDLELYREACKATRDKFGAPSETANVAEKKSVAQPVVAQVNQNRVERKRAAPATPTALNRAQPMDAQRSAPTGSDIVSAMRKARGQGSV